MGAGTRHARGSRRGRRPVEEEIVEGAPELAHTAEARGRLAQAFADVYVDVLLGALARQERGTNPVEAIREALAEAEGGAS